MRRLLIVAVVLGSVAWWVSEAPHKSSRPSASSHEGTSWSDWPEPPLPPRTPSHRGDGRRVQGRVRLSISGSGLEVEDQDHTVRVSTNGIMVNDRADARETCPQAVAAPEPRPVSEPAPVPTTHLELAGDWMSTTESAVESLRSRVVAKTSEWLAPTGVPSTWRAPGTLIDAMIVTRPRIESEAKDYAPDDQMYRARADVDFSSQNRRLLVGEYHREISAKRLGILGGILALAMGCLGIVAGYIRADEATKGYYTNRLRLLAAAGFGAAGAVVYQWLTRV